jgi:uncharacterized membrane protein (UPF0127 family)
MFSSMRRLALLMLVLLASCGGEEGDKLVIDTGEGDVEVPVEVADSRGERQVGLMNRESLPEDSGMVFLFPEPTTGGFWMKNTLIPLSIAFYGRDGTIVRILDMDPCRADPCPIYEPGVAYTAALEVNQGAFARWGVSEGDVVRLER